MFGIGSMMPIRHDCWYSVEDDTRYQLHTVFGDWEDRAVDAGEDYHSNHDGWESQWPLTITLYETEEGPAMARFDVEREAVPQFSARELPLASDARIAPVADQQAVGSAEEDFVPSSRVVRPSKGSE